MGEQVAPRDGAPRGLHVVDGPAWVAQHPGRRKLRRPAGDGIVEVEAPLVVERQRRQGRDGLAHRGDAEEGVALDGQAPLEAALAHALGEEHAPALVDEGGGAGDVALLNEGAQGVVKAVRDKNIISL